MNLKQNGTIKIISVIVLCFFTWSFIGASDIAHAELYMSISGTVKDAATGKGIAGVQVLAVKGPTPLEVSLLVEESYYANTDNDGNFTIKAVPPGTYNLFINSLSAYVRSNKPFPLTVNMGKNIVGLDIRLDKAGSVSGRVFQKDGVTPIKGATVAAYTSEEDLSFGETNGTGDYVITGLKETDSCTIVVLPDGYGGMYKENIHVSREQTTTAIDFVFNPDLSTGINGTVTDQNGSAVPNAIIVFYGKTGGGKTVTDSAGKFSAMGLTPETYTAKVIASGYEVLEEFNIQVYGGRLTGINFSVSQKESMNITSKQSTLKQSGATGTSGFFSGCEGCKMKWEIPCTIILGGACVAGCAALHLAPPAGIACDLACHFTVGEPLCLTFVLAKCSAECNGGPPPHSGPGGDHPDETFSPSNAFRNKGKY